MSEFEKWRKSLDLEEADKLMPIARVGWLAALKRTFEEYQKSPKFGGWIRKEISDMENER